MLKRDHHFIKLAEQRHKFGNTEISRIGTDGTASDAVVAGTLVRLPVQLSLMPQRLLPSHQHGRAVQHQPFGFLGCHKFARGRIDQLYALIAHVPELLDKRLHITVSAG